MYGLGTLVSRYPFVFVIISQNFLLPSRRVVSPTARREVYETFYHLLFQCERFEAYKREIFLDLQVEQGMDWTPQQLLDFASHPDINTALDGFFDGVHYNESLAD